MSIVILLLLLLITTSQVLSIAIDNELEGGPIVECGAGKIRISFSTKNSFYGRVYIKGVSNDERCVKKGSGIENAISMEIPFENCNLARIRSLSPRGIYVTTTVVISFHPYFLTKTDHAYRIQCLYLEAEKLVTANLGVQDPPNLSQLQTPPMPSCHYEILENEPNGKPLMFATIGSQVYHKWTCDSNLKNTYCMLVHSCIVDDGTGEKILILDDQGCAVDKFLLGNLEYPNDLTAGKEAHVYKYADREMLFFECRISVSLKNKHMECPRPRCAQPIGFGSALKPKSKRPKLTEMKKRSIDEGILDVRAELYAIDLPSYMGNTNGVFQTNEVLGEDLDEYQRSTSIFLLSKIVFSSLILFISFCLVIIIFIYWFHMVY